MKRGMWKRLAASFLGATLSLGTLAACGGSGAQSSSSTDDASSSQSSQIEPLGEESLTLNAYTVTLYVGETYGLTPTKKDEYGVTQAISKVEYEVEKTNVLNCSNGILTALNAGETYVNVTADGMQVACFVTVLSGAQADGLAIRFAEGQLYTGIRAQAYVYATTGGATERVTDVVWEVDENLSVTASGVVTPKKATEGATVKATGTYKGEAYTLETTVKVSDPLHYTISQTSLLLASTKTYAGADNAKYTKTSLYVNEYNLLTGASRTLTSAEMEVSTEAGLLTATCADDGKVTVESTSAVGGEASMYVYVKAQDRRVKITVNVANALASVADMDKLALASLVNAEDLSKSYLLVNDIDYEGGVIYPIASAGRENNNRMAGVHWKYLLDKEGGTYKFVARENVGKVGYGLTDAEFIEFYNAKGVNPKSNTYKYAAGIKCGGIAFTGTFDGNGYAIKNAQLMYGSYLTSKTSLYAAYSSLFGYTVDATIRNAAFYVNMQTPEEVPDGVNLSQAVVDGVLTDIEMPKTVKGEYQVFRAGLIHRATATTVENVFVDYAAERNMSNGSEVGSIIAWGDGITVQNCVARLTNAKDVSSVAVLVGAASNYGTANTIRNNFGIGRAVGEKNGLTSKQNGQDGNWYTSSLNWSRLFEETQGGEATNVKTAEETRATYDTSIWDVSKFNASDNGAPTLRNGCSVPTP